MIIVLFIIVLMSCRWLVYILMVYFLFLVEVQREVTPLQVVVNKVYRSCDYRLGGNSLFQEKFRIDNIEFDAVLIRPHNGQRFVFVKTIPDQAMTLLSENVF